MPEIVTRVVAILLGALFLASPTSARDPAGTPAWSITPLVVYEGPGNAYRVLGDVAGEERVRVERCNARWCRLYAGSGHARGWVSRDGLSFGTQPTLLGVNPDYKSGGPGEVCLYEGRNYTGRAVCATSGRVFQDLLLYDLDDRFSSVTVEGNVSVTLCRDREFKSYCERINDSMPRLPGFLDGAVSSVRVY